VRLEKSAKLLKFSKKPISEIATECGFSSSSTLSRAFKQYFGVSPSGYRTNGEIENSKICKELFNANDYHCDISEELKARFPIEIRELPERRIAYIRVLDSFKEGVVIKAFETLVDWSKKMTLYDSQTIFGMSMDDPMVTPKEKYRYEVAITLPEKFKIDQDNYIETMTLPKCKYAVATVSGDFNLVATVTHYLFKKWLINSPFEPEHQHGMEVFLDKEKICDWSYFNLELCVPVKTLRK
jgi:AraC family transcriptional regulator